MNEQQRNAIDACMTEAGQPPPIWSKDWPFYTSNGTEYPTWGHSMPPGVKDHEQWSAYYRQALIVVGIVEPDYYDKLEYDYPVGRIQ